MVDCNVCLTENCLLRGLFPTFCGMYKPGAPKVEGDKYSGYSQEVARILRKFDEAAAAETTRAADISELPYGIHYGIGYRDGLKRAQQILKTTADRAEREYAEVQAGARV